MDQQLDNLPKNKYQDGYEEYIVKYNKFNFFKSPLKPYVHESSAVKYAVMASLLMVLPTALKSPSVFSMMTVLSTLAYATSVFFAVQAYFKFKEYNFPSRLTPLSQPISLLMVAILLAGLPSFMSVSTVTSFSSGSPVLNHPVLNKYSILKEV